MLNLLSVAASYGLLVAVFRFGVGAGLLGVHRSGADRGLDPDLAVRHAVRPLDGLRGVPRVADARGLGRGGATTPRPSRSGWSAPGGVITAAALVMTVVVRRLRRRQRSGTAAVRPGPGARRPHRRDARAGVARPVADGRSRPLELVAAGRLRPAAPSSVSRRHSMKRKPLLLALAATSLFLAAPTGGAAVSPTVRLAIAHVAAHCHVWRTSTKTLGAVDEDHRQTRNAARRPLRLPDGLRLRADERADASRSAIRARTRAARARSSSARPASTG